MFEKKNVLLILSSLSDSTRELLKNFCGATIDISVSDDTQANEYRQGKTFEGKTVYLCGDFSKSKDFRLALPTAKKVFIIRDISYDYEESEEEEQQRRGFDFEIVGLGRVPLSVHGVGVLYPGYFVGGNLSDKNNSYFHRIHQEHAFQSLTESTKPGIAHRTGIYLTPVTQDSEGNRHFHLLRCSSNFSGPTENFGPTDHHIVGAMNEEASDIFGDTAAPLNHVLAQTYHNTVRTGTQKETKAKIKAHSDKTKDMPENGVMAFVTFYDGLDKLKRLNKRSDGLVDLFDYGYGKGVSALTKLHFRLKSCAEERYPELTKTFSVTLYPGSVFFMPLSTNRLYTHEIRPPALNAEHLPTRMGYVVRCSDTKAVHRIKDGKTFLQRKHPLEGQREGDDLIEMVPPTSAGMSELRKLYADENRSDAFVNYGRDFFLFSMNEGDYVAPVYEPADEFRVYGVADAGESGLFDKLIKSVPWETVGKGRQGAVLVRPDKPHGVPIVRTTTKYEKPAICFQAVHDKLARAIQKCASTPNEFNNALIENYTTAYAKMGFHSDQALDLQDSGGGGSSSKGDELSSCIAVFSCYDNPDGANRKLVVEPKVMTGTEHGDGTFEIPLRHNSVVVWNLDANRRFRHKIVLDNKNRGVGTRGPAAKVPDSRWLGVTFRTSKTFVKYTSQPETSATVVAALLEDGTPLTLATRDDEQQTREFYSLRGRENRETSFVYPSSLTYTISPSDLMVPVGLSDTSHETKPEKRNIGSSSSNKRPDPPLATTADAHMEPPVPKCSSVKNDNMMEIEAQ